MARDRDDRAGAGAPAGPAGVLPPGLDLLWSRRERGRQGRKAELSVEAIVQAAIAVADAEGLSAVSMARVAKELGFSTMSLYRHVHNKDELLQAMWNAGVVGTPVVSGADWRAKLEDWSVQQWRMLWQRTWLLEMPVIHPPAGPSSLAWLEQAAQALADTGLSEDEKFGCIGLISAFNLSEARMAYEERQAAGGGAPMDYAAVLRAVADRETFPALHRAAWSGELDRPAGATGWAAADSEAEASYRFGLARILDGIAALVERTR